MLSHRHPKFPSFLFFAISRRSFFRVRWWFSYTELFYFPLSAFPINGYDICAELLKGWPPLANFATDNVRSNKCNSRSWPWVMPLPSAKPLLTLKNWHITHVSHFSTFREVCSMCTCDVLANFRRDHLPCFKAIPSLVRDQTWRCFLASTFVHDSPLNKIRRRIRRIHDVWCSVSYLKGAGEHHFAALLLLLLQCLPRLTAVSALLVWWRHFAQSNAALDCLNNWWLGHSRRCHKNGYRILRTEASLEWFWIFRLPNSLPNFLLCSIFLWYMFTPLCLKRQIQPKSNFTFVPRIPIF